MKSVLLELTQCISGAVNFLFSLKGLTVVVAGVLLFWPDIRPLELKEVDRALQRIASQLAPPSPMEKSIALIQMESEQIQALLRDPASLYGLDSLLSDHYIGLILPNAVREYPVEAETWLEKAELTALPEALQGWREKAAKNRAFHQRLQQGKLLVGLTQGGVSSFPEQAIPVNDVDWNIDWVPNWLVKEGQLSRIPWFNRGVILKAAQWPVDPILMGAVYRAVDVSSPGSERQLLWKQGSQFHAGLALALHLKMIAETMGVEEEPSVLFQSGYRIDMAHRSVFMSNHSQILPAHFTEEAFSRYQWSDVVRNPPAESIWIIGEHVDHLNAVAGTLMSLRNSEFAYRPFWSEWLGLGLMLVLLVYLLWFQPQLQLPVAVLMAIIVTVSMIIVQLGWQLTYQEILPLPLVLEWFVFGSIVMAIWQHRTHSLLQLQRNHQAVCLQLANEQYLQNRLEEALASIQNCKPTQSILTLRYDIAAQWERKRHYVAASDLYQAISGYDEKFKDASNRAEVLKSLSQPAQVMDYSVTQSLVLPHQEISKPVLGRYQIEYELGRGAMGVVYLGVDSKIARKVAIKTLNYQEFDRSELEVIKERFFREAEAAGRLTHPNIVTVFDVGEEVDLAFIAMDYVEGSALDRYVSSESLLDIDEVYTIVAMVAEALDYAHKQKVVHRDIKPGNIIYNREQGHVKVADFGVARIVDDSKTKTGDTMGSPVYMSPEQLKAQKVTGQSDIYSLGVTFYQLLTGALPFQGDSVANLTYQILNKKYKSIRELRPTLSAAAVRIVNKALQKNSAKRYQTAEEMANAIRSAQSREFGRKAG